MFITENQLDEWVRGNARDAQGVVVELVWRLVAASSPQPKERRFPLGDSIGQRGPDGLLDVDLAFDPFVPDGRSFWEIGTGLNARAKATSDYDDLVDSIPEETRHQSTFIFVTPLSGRRDWEHSWKEEAQGEWLENRRARNDWRAVRVIDGTKLVDWLHQFPPVELWLARKIHGPHVAQLDTPEQHWSLVRSIGEPPPLSAQLFLANRDEAVSKLNEIVAGTVVRLRLNTHYPDHVMDFVSAYIDSLDTETRADALGRWLFVGSAEAWEAMVARRERLVLVAGSTLDLSGDAGTKLIQKAHKAGHAVVLGGPAGGVPDPSAVALRVPMAHQVREALEHSGYNDERARTLAQRSGGNLGSLLRCLQDLSILPEWAEGSLASDLAIAAALGAWTDANPSDQAVVESLSGKAYGEWIGGMREIAHRPGAPLMHWAGAWKFTMRYEGWYTLGPKLFDEHLDSLLTVAERVLSEDDPQFELAAEERFAARIHSKVLAHSDQLRAGLSESLALLGSHPKALLSCSPNKAEATAFAAVRSILAKADWRRWASLTELLPLLAEASPQAFLNAIEEALAGEACPFDRLFAEESSGFMGRSYMSGVLWALETLAWDPDYLGRVVLCLGELAARDPGGNWGNRPSSSLTAILLPWLPQTCAVTAKRRSAVSTLLREQPGAGWKLVLSLLPESHASSSYARKPAWRETIPPEWSERVLQGDYWEEASFYSELAVTEARLHVPRLVELLGHVENLPVRAFNQLLSSLSPDAILGLSEDDRFTLWTELTDILSRHRRFANAKWAMGSEAIEQLSAIADQLAPATPEIRHRRLFSDNEFQHFHENGDYDAQSEALQARREAAVQEIAATGVRAVLAFSATVESPWRVGFSFGKLADLEVDSTLVPSFLDAAEKHLTQFSGGFVWSRFRARGWAWVDKIDMLSWTPTQVGSFFALLPFRPETWARAEQHLAPENRGVYWTKATANPYEADGADLDRAVDALIEHGRPLAALRCLHKALHDKKTVDAKRATRALLAAVASREGSHATSAHDTVEIIQALQADSAMELSDLLRVEWSYLPLLIEDRQAAPEQLNLRLATTPDFFCEVVRAAFRSNKEESTQTEKTEKDLAVARNAYRLLSEWSIPPGTQVSGAYDGEALDTWLNAVKVICKETGHLEMAMTMLGQALTHAPQDPDGLWIHRSAAAALDAKDAKEMRLGFRTELYNSRGAHFVDRTGAAERALASRFRERSEDVEAAGYSRLATTVRELASGYERQAERILAGDPLED